ncbi:TPA: ead/Ea22-like family protein [Klebsiella pneumoniae]|nr:ead/Ea22-like family protein [Klebsiella pneumoniae]
MTTDITELAQSLKAAAENAIGAHERLAAYPYGEIIDISQQEGEQIDIDITDINEFLEEASPANILALVDALEKAQQQNISDFEIKARLCKESNSLHDRLREADKRIAELESRTVKLPDLRQIVSGDRYVWSDGVYNYSQDVKVALAAAGIKVEAE